MKTNEDYKKDRQMVIEELQTDWKFNKEQAEIIEEYTYQEFHSYWNDYLTSYEYIADMVKDVINAG